MHIQKENNTREICATLCASNTPSVKVIVSTAGPKKPTYQLKDAKCIYTCHEKLVVINLRTHRQVKRQTGGENQVSGQSEIRQAASVR